MPYRHLAKYIEDVLSAAIEAEQRKRLLSKDTFRIVTEGKEFDA